MNKHTKAFIEYAEEVSAEEENDSIVRRAISKSQYYYHMKEDPECDWTDRQILMYFKDDLIGKWKFLMGTEDRFDIKKVKFWDVMDYFRELKVKETK